MTSFLPVFWISATVELDRRGRRKFPRDARVAGSTGDSHDDADRGGGLELADDRRLPVLTLRSLLKIRVSRGGRALRSARRRRLGPLLVHQSAGLRGFHEPLHALLGSRRGLRLLRLSRCVLLACLLLFSPGAVRIRGA